MVEYIGIQQMRETYGSYKAPKDNLDRVFQIFYMLNLKKLKQKGLF